MGTLSFLEYEALRDRALRWGREIATDIKTHITNELERFMSQLSDELAGYKADVERQFQQIRDQFAPIIEGLQNDKVDAEARAAAAVEALTAMQADVASNVESIQAERAELQADDPAAPPVEPPIEPTP